LEIEFMIAARLVAVLFILVPAGALAASPEPPPGAASCSGCHSTSRVTTPVPRIYGRPADTIVTLVAAFRSGARPATVMDRISKGFTDEEMAAIAAWLETQK
jgi:cytochrome subunit of sulfide dehydrogenase